MKSGFSISRRREYGNLISHWSNIWHRSNIWHQSNQKRERIHLMLLTALLNICGRAFLAIVCQSLKSDVVSNSHALWYFTMRLINESLYFGRQVEGDHKVKKGRDTLDDINEAWLKVSQISWNFFTTNVKEIHLSKSASLQAECPVCLFPYLQMNIQLYNHLTPFLPLNCVANYISLHRLTLL